MVDPESRRIIPTANYEMIALSQALDLVRIALAPVLTSANERLVKLLQASLSGLSHGLEAPGSSYGTALSELAWTAQALTPEARLLAQPVSTEIASTSQTEGTEDRISLAPLSARRTAEMVALGEQLIAIGLVVAAQAVDLRAAAPLGAATGRCLASVRERVPFIGPDDSIPSDLSPVRDWCGQPLSGRGCPVGAGPRWSTPRPRAVVALELVRVDPTGDHVAAPPKPPFAPFRHRTPG